MQTEWLFCNEALLCVTWPGGIDKFLKSLGTGSEWCEGNVGAGRCENNTSFVWVADAVCYNLIGICGGWLLSPTETITLRQLFASESSVSSFWLVLLLAPGCWVWRYWDIWLQPVWFDVSKCLWPRTWFSLRLILLRDANFVPTAVYRTVRLADDRIFYRLRSRDESMIYLNSNRWHLRLIKVYQTLTELMFGH